MLNYKSFCEQYPELAESVSESDWIKETWEDSNGEYVSETWVEVHSSVPGELDDNENLAFMACSGRPGDISHVTHRRYI